MPEDQVIEEEISEQEPDPDAEAGFDEFAEDEAKSEKPEKKPSKPVQRKIDEKEKVAKKPEAEPEPEPKPDEEKPEEEKPESEPDEEKPAEGDEEPEEELTAKQLIDKRIEELKGDTPEQDKPEEEKPEAGAPTPDEMPKVSKRLTKEQIQQHMGLISDDDLPEGEIIIGDDTFNFDELKEDDPQTFNAMKVISSIAGAKYLNAALQSGQFVKAEVVDELKKEMARTQYYVSYTSEMASRGHGDVWSIVHSDDYKEWIDKESEGVKMLADSPDIEDAVRVLNYYKETVAKTKTSEHDKAAQDKHDRKNKLLKGKKTTKPAGPSKQANENEDEAAFNEFAE